MAGPRCMGAMKSKTESLGQSASKSNSAFKSESIFKISDR